MNVSHPSPPLPQSWEDAWSAVPELQEMPQQFGRVCHRLLGNSDICRLPLKCGSKLHHCWHHMGNLRVNLQATIHSLLGHFRILPGISKWRDMHCSHGGCSQPASNAPPPDTCRTAANAAHAPALVVTAKCCGVREGVGKVQRHLNLFWVSCLFMFCLGMLTEFSPLSAARASIYNNMDRQSSRLAPVGLHTVENVFNYEKLKTRRMCLD